MKRNIITIDEEKCNGCGLCVPDCPEGALQIIDGKARLVSDLFCDGLGACIKTCPQGAMTIEVREAEPYDERRVMENVVKQGANVVRAHLQHLDEHGESEFLGQAVDFLREKGIDVPDYSSGHHHEHGCPGARAMAFSGGGSQSCRDDEDVPAVHTELRQWPVQLKLLNPNAPYFKNADLLLAADCAPFSYGNFHPDFIRGRIVIMFCPKLDPHVEEYIDKLAAICANHDIRSITIARMEVPCCGGVGVILERALQKAGKSIPVTETVISIKGDILSENTLSPARAL